ncbi:HipA family kinase [uncultured Clostridium sp.]|uniref:HipA family kinase n=1 Tax=uncultured Clostridium sp. TaxID=59620 RepID=UPI0026330E09|nr:HipA family kinase [uncultured Clostridium sp.]
MKELEVEMFLKNMGQGASRPALIICDDYQHYVIKNERVEIDGQTHKSDCMFVNELLAFQIGEFLDVPVPESVIAIVNKETVESDPEVRFQYKFEAGRFFASKNLEQVENNILDNFIKLRSMKKPFIKKSWNKFFQEVNNKEDIAKILAFDILIANFDRYNNMGNILINLEGANKKIYAIDHGHSFFGLFWNTNKIGCLKIETITQEYIMSYSKGILETITKNSPFSQWTIFGALQEHIDIEDENNHSFKDIVNRIKSLNETMIEEWLDNIPEEWYVNKTKQKAYYINFLMKQKNIVENIIQVLAENGAFTNYTGGVLRYECTKKENTI